MGLYVGYVRNVVDRLNVHSFADMTLSWMEGNNLLTSPTLGELTSFNDSSINLAVQVVSRVVCAYFFYPKISTPGAVINGSLGVVHLGIGVIERFRTTEKPAEAREKWNSIALQIHKGFAHILAGAYDFGTGYLLKRQYYLLFGAITLFAIMPQNIFRWHQKVYLVPPKPKTEPAPLDSTSLYPKIIEDLRRKFDVKEVALVGDDPAQHVIQLITAASAKSGPEAVLAELPFFINALMATAPKVPIAPPIDQTALYSRLIDTIKTKFGLQAPPVEAEKPAPDAQPETQASLITRLIATAKDKSGAEAVLAQLPDLFSSMLPAAPAEPKEPQDKVVPKYLAPTCLIYRVAKAITLEMMPAIEPTTEPLYMKPLGTIRRIFSTPTLPLPDYGL